METILDYLKRKLKEVGSAHWEEVSAAAGVSKSLPRKLAYERENPGVNTVQPLLDYFKAVDADLERFPWDGGRKAPPAPARRERDHHSDKPSSHKAR